MTAPRPPLRPDVHVPSTLFGRQRPDHIPAETLTNAELPAAIASLERKLRSAKQSLLAAHIAGAALTAVLFAAGGVLLWFGPTPFLETVFRRTVALQATTYDIFAWWAAVVFLAVVGGVFADQLVRGKLRLARGWKTRVVDLTRRLEDARRVQQRRSGL